MEKINDGGPAFPLPLGNENIDPSVAGMTLRDKFADSVLPACYQGYVSFAAVHGWSPDWHDGVAMDAYKMADAMLKAREVKS